MPHMTDDYPRPPRRLVTDYVLQRFEAPPPAWEARRASKVKERFPLGFHYQPLPSMNLIAPVQPMTGMEPFRRTL